MLADLLLSLTDSPTLQLGILILLFLGACAGHAGLVMLHLNILYGHDLPRRNLRKFRRFGEGFVLISPLVFFFAFGFDHGVSASNLPTDGWRFYVYHYALACNVIGWGVLPVVTVYRWLRRTPAALVSNDSRIVDVAQELGYRPYGHGKHRKLAMLPWNQVFQVEFSERTFRLPQLPAAWDGLSILHLSDVHFCGTPDRAFYQYVVDRCRDWSCDLVAVTGDVVDSSRHHRWVVPILGRLRWNVAGLAILGNHDCMYDPKLTRRRLRKIGMRVLGNCWEQIDVRGQPMIVVGHEGPWFAPEPDLASCPRDGFRLCLSHTPDNMPWARRHRMDLVLAGHVHGGQIRFPGIGSVFVPSRYSRRYDCGTFHEAPTLMHVSRGLAGQEPLRYHCRPEVTRIVLRAGCP